MPVGGDPEQLIQFQVKKVASWAGKGLSPHQKAMGVVEQRRGGAQQKQRGWGLPAEANELSS